MEILFSLVNRVIFIKESKQLIKMVFLVHGQPNTAIDTGVLNCIFSLICSGKLTNFTDVTLNRAHTNEKRMLSAKQTAM